MGKLRSQVFLGLLLCDVSGSDMQASTLEIIKTALKADLSLSAADRARLLSLLRNGQAAPKFPNPNPEPPRLIRRAEAARRLSRSVRNVDQLAAQGVLHKQKLPGRTRAAGFLESDINLLLVGNRLP